MTRLLHSRITEADLPEICQFLDGRQLGDDSSGETVGAGIGGNAMRRNLRWRLLENPAARDRDAAGLCVRREDGQVVGALLSFPARFVLGDRILVGLCGSGFFVEPEFRLQGFLLFRRFLAEPGVDFWFATTSNAAAGALWGKLGGKAPAYACHEYFLPLRFGPLVQEALLRRGVAQWLTGPARAAGSLLSPWLRPRPATGGLHLSLCRDWDRLAHLAQRHRDRSSLSALRSAPDLEWRYDKTPARSATRVFLFRDSQGHEGWVSLGESRRGRAKQIRAWMVLDLVHPREQFDLSTVFTALLRQFVDCADLIAIRGPEVVARAALAARARPRSFDGPTIFLISGAGAGQDLSAAAEFFPADGDTAS